MTVRRKIIGIALGIVTVASSLIVFASPANALSGGLIDWSHTYGSDGSTPLANGNLYIIDDTGSRFAVQQVAGQIAVRTDVPTFYRYGPDNNYNCVPVHCLFVSEANLGSGTQRTVIRTSDLDSAGRYTFAEVGINTYWAWDTSSSAFLNLVGVNQAIYLGAGLDYKRPANVTSVMSIGMNSTVCNSNDLSYINSLW